MRVLSAEGTEGDSHGRESVVPDDLRYLSAEGTTGNRSVGIPAIPSRLSGETPFDSADWLPALNLPPVRNYRKAHFKTRERGDRL